MLGPALVALYLKDCFLLLGRDEAVLVRGWRGRWRAGFGLLDWRLRRRLSGSGWDRTCRVLMPRRRCAPR